jgi:Dioxygenase
MELSKRGLLAAALAACIAAGILGAGSLSRASGSSGDPGIDGLWPECSQDQESAAPPSIEPAEIEAIIDRAEQALISNGSDTSAILSDARYLSVHAWPRFRALIKAHARGSRVTIVTPQEPGKRLRARMHLVEADGSAAAGALVYFYHTDAAGDYGPNDAHVPLTGSDNNYARLFGYAVTGPDGTIEIRTIRPGGYPDSDAPAHIHIRITCRDKRSFGAEVWFDDDARVDREAREEAARGRIVICPVAIDAQGADSIDAGIKLD